MKAVNEKMAKHPPKPAAQPSAAAIAQKIRAKGDKQQKKSKDSKKTLKQMPVPEEDEDEEGSDDVSGEEQSSGDEDDFEADFGEEGQTEVISVV